MEFLSFLMNGISLGSIYAIIALGYTMVYGIAKMLNFAHGDIIMVGGYLVFTCMNSLSLPPVVSVLIAMVACTLLGITIERIAVQASSACAKPGSADYSHWRKLLFAEYGAAYLGFCAKPFNSLYCLRLCACLTGAGYLGNACHNYSFRHYHGCAVAVCKQDKNRPCNAGRL